MDDNQGSGPAAQQDVLQPRSADLNWSLRLFKDTARRDTRTMTPAAFLVLDALLSFADWAEEAPGSNCFPSREKIADAVGRSPRTVDDHLRSLEKGGWIRRIPFIRVTTGQRTADLFQFCIPEYVEGPEAGLMGPLDWTKRKAAIPASAGSALWAGRTALTFNTEYEKRGG